MRTRAAIVSLLAIALGGELAVDARAQQSEGLYTIAPPRRELRAEPPTELGSTALGNTTRKSLAVRVFAARLGQELDGSFVPLEADDDLVAARRIVAALPKRFELGPGEVRDVSSRWNRLPGKSQAAYIALIFEGVPPASRQSSIRTIVRLSQPNLLMLPGAAARRGALSGLRAARGTGRRLVFYPRVRNDSQVHGRPRDTRLRIADEAGRVVFERAWPPGPPVLPGAEVEYPVQMRKVLPAGDYVATASMRFEDARKRRSRKLPFTLIGPNELPVTEFALKEIGAGGEVGGPASVAVALRNTGTATGAADLMAELREANGEADEPLATEAIAIDEIQPGETVTAALELGELRNAAYRVDVVAVTEGAESDRIRITFTASPARRALDGIRDFIDDRLVCLLVGLFLIAVIAGLFFRYRELYYAYEELLRRSNGRGG